MTRSSLTQYILAVDIGGTKTAAALVDTMGVIHKTVKEPTCQTGPEDGFNQIFGMLEEIIESAKLPKTAILGIGVGIPAVLEPETDRIIWGPNLTGWKNVDLRTRLENLFNVDTAIEYDGHTAALGEWWIGAGQFYQSFVSVIIGTGIGGGMILDGRLFRGNNRLAGAAGWFVVPDDKTKVFEPSHYSNLGFWESKAAGPGVTQLAQQALETFPKSSLAGIVENDPLSTSRIFQAYSQADPLAVQVVGDLSKVLGRGVANIISLINPEAIILGGGLGSALEFLLPMIEEEAARWAQPISAREVEIKISALGPEAGLLGAAYGLMLRRKEEGKEN